jgi:hypothetical protein
MSAHATPRGVLQVEGKVSGVHNYYGVRVYDVEIQQGALRRKVEATKAPGVIREVHIGNRVLVDLASSTVLAVGER